MYQSFLFYFLCQSFVSLVRSTGTYDYNQTIDFGLLGPCRSPIYWLSPELRMAIDRRVLSGGVGIWVYKVTRTTRVRNGVASGGNLDFELDEFGMIGTEKRETREPEFVRTIALSHTLQP
jgi:hypothetical protein